MDAGIVIDILESEIRKHEKTTPDDDVLLIQALKEATRIIEEYDRDPLNFDLPVDPFDLDSLDDPFSVDLSEDFLDKLEDATLGIGGDISSGTAKKRF